MNILFDHNVDRRLRAHLSGHQVVTAREMGWETLKNRELIRAAAAQPFEVLLSIDKNLEHEQNLQTLPLPIIVLDSTSNALPALLPFTPHLLGLLQQPLDTLLHVIDSNGRVLRLTQPRP